MPKSLLFLLIFFITQQAFAQNTSKHPRYLKSYFTDTRDIITEPLRWDKHDIANATIIVGATAFLMVHDEKLHRFVSVNQNKNLGNVFHYAIAPFGNGIYTLPLLSAVYLGGVAGNNSYDKSMALLGLKTFIISAGEATVIKMAFQRHRPGDNTPPDAFRYDGPFDHFSDNGSLVSRHATTAFAVATVFARGYKSEKKWVPWVAYSLASLVTISRVYEKEHWASDAFAGACLGYVTGRFMFDLNRKFLNKRDK